MIASARSRSASATQPSPVGRRAMSNFVIFVAVVVVFGSQLGGLSASLKALQHADAGQLSWALVAVVLTFLVGALAYRALATKRIRLLPTLQVQVASGFVNRLLPAGLGSLGLFAAYFRKQGMTVTQASAVVVTNNILGVIGNLLLITVVILAQPQYAEQLRLPHISTRFLTVLITVLAVASTGLVILRERWGERLAGAIRTTLIALRTSLRPNRFTAQALLYNALLSGLNAAALALVAAATGGHLGWPAALLVLSAGTLIGAAVPTPGGIGGVEAGLLAGLIAYGMSASDGLATIVLYRGLTYWLPIIPGFILFQRVKKLYL